MRLNFSVSIAKDAYQAHVSRKKFTQKRVRTNSMRHNFRNVKTENMAIFQNLSFHTVIKSVYSTMQHNFRLKDVKKCLFTTIVLYEIKLKRSQGSYFSPNCPIFYLSFDIALSTPQKVAFIDFFQPSIGGISGPHVGDESSIWNTVVSTLENNNLSSCP